MQIDNAAIQFTTEDPRPIHLLTAKGYFPTGVHFPTGVGVQDPPHWIDMDTTRGELGVFGKGGGKNEIFGR
jgi:hypothetical protein